MGSPNQLSFLPDDYLERKAQRRTNAVCAVLFLVVIGGVGTAFTMSENATKIIDKQYSKIEENSEAKVFDVYMKVSGTAYNDGQVAQFIAKLSKSKLLKDVNLSVTDEFIQGDDKLRKFQIEMMLDPDVDIQALEKKSENANINV